MKQHIRMAVALGVLTLMLGGCGGQDNTADPAAAPAGTYDTNRFWIFPNPVKEPATGVYTTNEASYAQAYYAVIGGVAPWNPAEIGNARATLQQFKAANNFGVAQTGVTELNVIFRDAKDLGYGRKMTVRFTDPSAPGYVPANHRVAVFVENYQVVPFAGDDYTALNLEAAITGNTNYHVGTNAIEYSIVNNVPMTRFYTYAPGTGVRLNTVNLDGRGQKAMPSVCINCHGGRADPLSATGVFPNSGNVRARLQPIHVDSVEFWNAAPYRRADQEEALRQINYAFFCGHTYPGAAAGTGVDSCRPLQGASTAVGTTGGHDYQGAAAEMMKAWYAAGINTPGATFADNYLPSGWADAAVAARAINPISLVQQKSLYDNVVAPYCRVCHVTRGTENQSDIDFTSYLKFEGYADRIKAHAFDRGNMPLGLIIYNAFWKSSAPEQLADWLASLGSSYNPSRVGGGATGKPVQPSGELTDPAFLATGVHSTTNYIGYPANTTFATIKGILQSAEATCSGCHYSGDWGVGYTYSPPIAYTDYDRNNDTFVNAADDYEFYKALRGRVNLTDMLASPLLRKPSGFHHGGGQVLNTASATVCGTCGVYGNYGAYYTGVYNTFLDWIEHGAPYSYTGSTPNY